MSQLLNTTLLLLLLTCFQFCSLTGMPECGRISNCNGPSCSDRSPWHAVILPGNQLENQELCGGTLISENLIITAAICVQSKQITAFKITVILGIGSETHTNLTAKTTFIHSAGNGSEDRNVALIKLEAPITEWRDNIAPVCLPPKNNTLLKLEGKSATVSSWGISSENTKHLPKTGLNTTLKHQSLNFLSSNHCQDSSNDSTQLCIGAQEGYDSCIGDSGGGLILKEDNKYTIVGIIFSELESHQECKASYNNLVENDLLNWIGSIMKTQWFQPQIGPVSDKRYGTIANKARHSVRSDKLLLDPNMNITMNKKSREGRLINIEQEYMVNSQTNHGMPITTIILICVILILVPVCIALFFYLNKSWYFLENHSALKLSRIVQKTLYNNRDIEELHGKTSLWWLDIQTDQTKEERNSNLINITDLCKHELVTYIDDSTEQEKLLCSNVMEKTYSTSTLQSVANFRTLVFKNWKPLMKEAHPNSSENIIHSINEIFGLFDHSYPKLITILWNLENIIVENMEETISLIGMDDGPLMIDNSNYLNQTLYSLLHHIYGKDSEINSFTNEEDFKLLGINYKKIISTLLPSHAGPLIEAVEMLYPDNFDMKAFSVENIIERYTKLKYTSHDALNIILKTIKKGNADAPITSPIKDGESPTLIVDVALSDVTKLDEVIITEESANDLRNKLQTSLDAIRTNTRLQDWLWHKYHQNRIKNGLPVEKLTRNDFESISVEVVGIFYGSVIHASVMFKFDMEGGLSNETMLNKLETLEVICKIALENLKDILPQKHKISCKNSIITVDYDDTSENAETIVLENLRMLYRCVEENLDFRKILLKRLQEKNIAGFNTTEDIARLFSRREFTNVDKLKIRMSRFDQNLKKFIRIDANYTFWPCKTRPLNEMTNKDLSHIHDCFERNIPEKLYKPTSKYLIHALEIFQNNFELSGKMLAAVDTSLPFHQILSCLRENGASIEDLLISISQFKKEHYDINLSNTENEQLKKSFRALGETLNIWFETTFEDWKKRYSVELPPSTMSRSQFDLFIQASHHDLRQLKKMTKTELFTIIQNNEVYEGVQIWMCRLKKGIHYWHVGILVGKDVGDHCYNIVHVQPRKGISLEGKIIKEDFNKAVHDDDEILIIYYNQTLSRTQIKQRALLCCQPPKITFKYNGYLGSCETFCSFICGTRSIKDLNTQGFKVRFDPEEGLRKKIIAKGLHFKRERSADDLLSVIQNRLQQRSEEMPDERQETQYLDFSMEDQRLSDRQFSNSSIDIPNSIGQFLQNLELPQLEDIFLKECVSFEMLLELTDEHLKQIGISLFGHRFKIIKEAKRVKEEGQNMYISNSSLEPLSFSSVSYGYGSMSSQVSFR